MEVCWKKKLQQFAILYNEKAGDCLWRWIWRVLKESLNIISDQNECIDLSVLTESLHSVCSLWQLTAVILTIWSVGLCKCGYNTDLSLICTIVKISWHKPEEEIPRFQEAGWFIESIYMHLADQAYIIFFEKIQNLPPLTKLKDNWWGKCQNN